MSGKRLAILTGREHYYEHGNPAALRPALETLAALGAKTLVPPTDIPKVGRYCMLQDPLGAVIAAITYVKEG